MLTQSPVQIVVIQMAVNQQQVEDTVTSLYAVVCESGSRHRVEWSEEEFEKVGLTAELLAKLDEITSLMRQYRSVVD